MTLRTRVRRALDQRAPAVVSCFRDLRDAVRFHASSASATPFGFKLGGHEAMQRGDFEQEETRILRELIPEVDVFVDVGANIGLYTCLARHHGRHAIAIEPLAWNCAHILRNLAANEWADVEVFPVAVGSEPRILELYGSGTGASLVRGWAGWPALHRRIVPVSTLDILVGQRFSGQRMLIKIDAEGAEHRILTGAERLLSQEPAPIWFLEICLTEHHPGGANPSFSATFETFESLGYRCFIADDTRTPVSIDAVRDWQKLRRTERQSHNYVFTKA